jgi:hypothetical protein
MPLSPHKRKDIRKKLLELLKEVVDVGDRVEAQRPTPLWLQTLASSAGELPICIIYFGSEAATHDNSGPRWYRRRLILNVEVIHNTGVKNLDDFLDDRAFEVEFALLRDETLGELVNWCSLTETSPVVHEYEGESEIASIRLSFLIEYDVDTVKGVSIDEFLKFNTEYNTTDGAEAEDNVTIRSS